MLVSWTTLLDGSFEPSNRSRSFYCSGAKFGSNPAKSCEESGGVWMCQWPSYGPRWWPGKSPHPSGWSGLVQGGSSFGSGLAHAVGIAVGDHDIRVVQ